MLQQTPNPEFLQSVQPDEFIPPPSKWITMAGVILLATVGIILVLTSILKYKVAVKAPATIRPTGELRLVQAITEGKVKKIQVKANQKVQQGDIIAYIEDSRLQTQKKQLTNSISESQIKQIVAQIQALDLQIVAEKKVIERIIATANSELDIRKREYQDKQVTTIGKVEESSANVNLAQEELDKARADLISAKANLRSIQAALEGAIAHYNTYKPIAEEGAIPQDLLLEAKLAVEQQKEALESQKGVLKAQEETVERQQRQLEGAKAQLKQVKTALNPTYGEVSIAKARIAQQQAEGEAKLAALIQQKETLIQKSIEIKNQLDKDKQELLQIKKEIDNTVIRAPHQGIIQELNLRNADQVVRIGEVIAQIAPSDAPLEVKALVNNNDISKVEIGQKAQIRVSACPYPDYGVLGGTVFSISPDVINLQNNDFSDGKPQQPAQGISGYSVMIKPEKFTLTSGNKTCTIQAGMEVQTDIISKEETPLQFILRKARLIANT